MEDIIMEKIDDYLQINEAAAYLGISPSTLRNWEKQGKLSTHRNPINSYRL
jgi:MerR family copper efflux transcriptional regulator